jgi:hypothetical protein
MELFIGWERFSDPRCLAQRIFASARVASICDVQTPKPLQHVNTNDIEFTTMMCYPTAHLEQRIEFCPMPVGEELGQEVPDGFFDCSDSEDEYDTISTKKRRLRNRIQASVPIDGRPSCAAHDRCHLDLAPNSILCTMHHQKAIPAVLQLDTNSGINLHTLLRTCVGDSDWQLPQDAARLGQLHMLQHLTSPAM